MPIVRNEDEPDVVWVTLPVDLKTAAWLARISEEAHALPETVGASILRDVREDDELEHEIEVDRAARVNAITEGSRLN